MEFDCSLNPFSPKGSPLIVICLSVLMNLLHEHVYIRKHTFHVHVQIV